MPDSKLGVALLRGRVGRRQMRGQRQAVQKALLACGGKLCSLTAPGAVGLTSSSAGYLGTCNRASYLSAARLVTAVRSSPMAMAVLPVPGCPASSTPRPAILPSLIMAVMTPAAWVRRGVWDVQRGAYEQTKPAQAVQAGGGEGGRQVEGQPPDVHRCPGIDQQAAGGRPQLKRQPCTARSQPAAHAVPLLQHSHEAVCLSVQAAVNERRQRQAAAAARGLQAGCSPPHRPIGAAGTHLSRRGLPHEALRHRPRLQGVIEAQAADVGVRTDALYTCEVLDLRRHAQVRHSDRPPLRCFSACLSACLKRSQSWECMQLPGNSREEEPHAAQHTAGCRRAV